MSAASLCCGIRRLASLTSSSMVRALWIISLQDCCGAPSLVLFRRNHLHQAVVITNLSKFIPTCWTKIRCQRRSMNSLYCTPLRSIGIPAASQVSRADVQSQNKGPLVSLLRLQASQVGLSRTPRWQRFTFVGRILKLALLAKVFNLFRMLRLHMVRQKVLWVW